MINGSPRLTWNFFDCSVALRFVFLTQQQRLNCVDVFISMCMCTVSAADARTPVDCPELHQQHVDAALRPTFVQKLCYKLSSVVTYTFLQTDFWLKFCLVEVASFAWYTVKIRVISGVRFERRKVDKKQTHMKTETCRLYSRDFWIFLPNTIKIDPYNFELSRFKFVSFFWDSVYNEE